MKRLEDAQREIFARQTGLYNPSTPSTENDNQSNQENKHKPLKILRTITEVLTWWESKLAFWKWLRKLKELINCLYVTLALEIDREAKKDYQ